MVVNGSRDCPWLNPYATSMHLRKLVLVGALRTSVSGVCVCGHVSRNKPAGMSMSRDIAPGLKPAVCVSAGTRQWWCLSDQVHGTHYVHYTSSSA